LQCQVTEPATRPEGVRVEPNKNWRAWIVRQTGQSDRQLKKWDKDYVIKLEKMTNCTPPERWEMTKQASQVTTGGSIGKRPLGTTFGEKNQDGNRLSKDQQKARG